MQAGGKGRSALPGPAGRRRGRRRWGVIPGPGPGVLWRETPGVLPGGTDPGFPGADVRRGETPWGVRGRSLGRGRSGLGLARGVRHAATVRRIVVMGPPGSGKSTLARTLGAGCGLPVFHLDHAFWRPGWVRAPAETFRAEVERIAALPAWVIDGNYGGTLAPRLARANAVVFLDLPPRMYLPRVLRRALVGSVVGREQAPGCRERLDPAFLRYALAWRRERRGKDLALLEGFGGAVLVAGSDAEVARVAGWFLERHGGGTWA